MTVSRQLEALVREGGRNALQRGLQLQSELLLPELVHQDRFVFHQDDLALADHPDAVGHLLRLIDIVSRQDDRDAVGPQQAHHLPHGMPQLHIDTRGGLIKKQNTRLMRQRLSNHDPAFHPTGQRHDLRILFLPKRQVAQNLLDVSGIRGLTEQPPAEGNRVPHGLEHVGRDFLRHQPDLGPCGAEVPDDVVAVGLDCAPRRIDDPADDTDQSRLAGTVGAQQGEDLAAANLEIDVFEGVKAGCVDFCESGDRNDRLQGPSRGARVSAVGPVFLQSAELRASSECYSRAFFTYWIAILRGRSAARFGMRTLSTPSLTFASIWSVCSSRLSAKLRR